MNEQARPKGCRGCGAWCAVPGCSVCVKRTEYCVKCERIYQKTRQYPRPATGALNQEVTA